MCIMSKPSKPQENTTNPANISFVIVKEINVMARANTQKENATNTANISNEKETNVMARRAPQQIEEDFNRCQVFMATNNEVSSIEELASCLNLTSAKVYESYLPNHRPSYKRLKEKLAINRKSKLALKKAEAKHKAELEAAEAKHKAEQEAAEAKRKAEQEAAEAKRKAEQEAEAKRKAASRQTKKKVDKPSNKKKEDSIGGFVIDASIAGVEGIIDDLNRICVTQSKIILTTVTINELDKMQKFHDNDGYDARRILSMAACDSEHFESVRIDETLGTPDYCIIKYCADNKDNVVLLTADKTMALNARACGIKTHFFKHTVQNSPAFSAPATDDDIHKLHLARKINGKFYICDFENEFRSVRVVSDGIEYTRGTVKLKIGDDVYVTTKKFDYVTFAHYHVVSLSEDCNCTLVYHNRMYNSAEINNLPVAGYKSFMRDFVRRVDF